MLVSMLCVATAHRRLNTTGRNGFGGELTRGGGGDWLFWNSRSALHSYFVEFTVGYFEH
jgi:hypothetical protein